MPKYKVTKVFLVEAASKQAAVQQVTDEPGELLEYVSVFRQADGQSGWKASLRKQLVGK
jgi:hypothetical protein